MSRVHSTRMAPSLTQRDPAAWVLALSVQKFGSQSWHAGARCTMEPQMSRPALLRALKRNEERGPYHILRSIVTDALVVRLTAAHFPGLPVVGNLRTGAWYVEPEVSSAVPGAGGPTAYFKSSDGHPGAWIMPPSRLNLGFLLTVTTAGGAILVDSTRKGKRFPDRLLISLRLLRFCV